MRTLHVDGGDFSSSFFSLHFYCLFYEVRFPFFFFLLQNGIFSSFINGYVFFLCLLLFFWFHSLFFFFLFGFIVQINIFFFFYFLLFSFLSHWHLKFPMSLFPPLATLRSFQEFLKFNLSYPPLLSFSRN